MKLTIITSLAAVCAVSHAFVVNGSFESGVAYSGGPNIFSAGTPTPWVATAFTPDMYDNTGADGWNLAGIPAYQNMFANTLAFQGHRFIGFAVSTTMGFYEAFGQNVSGLTINATYTLQTSLITDTHASIPQYGGPYSGFGVVDVYFNNTQIGTFSANTVALTWQTRSFSFVAPAASGFLEFRATANPFDPVLQGSYMGMDDIGVVPEPAGLSVMLIGVAAIVRRRGRA
ncbi:MAG: hypothetical protein HZC36_15435 [Armatimonadetes bacterium]|nr:hypothetical protein [Armatimonadota bacterium]